MNKQTDIIVVGSGPGGATVARELARSGKKVTLLERGKDYRRAPYYGTPLGALMYTDRHSFLYTKEGLNIIRPLMVGGATSMYCGCAAYPPGWLKDRYQVDLTSYVDQAVEEIGIAPLPPEHRGRASTRIAEAAIELGYQWEPLLKFMRPERSKRFNCGMDCMYGCHCGAKWNAGEWVDDAVAAGCELVTEAAVDHLVIENRQVGGVGGRHRGRPFEIRAKVVVVAAGGIGTPLILQHAGLPQAGHGMTMDATTMVYGITKEKGIGNEPPMTWSYADDEIGYMLSTLIDPWLLYPIIMAQKNLLLPLRWYQWGQMLGVMIKIKDDISGGITFDGEISKPLTERDRFRLNHAANVSRQILIQAGADPDSIFMSPLRGTHPSGTVRLCDMLDRDLQTEVKNLYVCDASTFPEALDRPTVLTIIGLGKRLADHLCRTVLA